MKPMFRRREVEIDPARGEIRIYDKRRRLWAEYAVMQVLAFYELILFAIEVFTPYWWPLSWPGKRELRSRAVHGHAQCLRRRLRERGPALVLSRAGFEDRSTGLGVIPWQYIGAYRGRLFWIRRPTLCLYRDGIMAWIAAVPENAWMAEAVDLDLGDIEDYGLPIIQSGDGTLPISMDDLLWLIGRHAQADGVPQGYRPRHLALIGLSPRAS